MASPVACESCKGKKCKCDRILPSCSQCLAVGGSCRYPPSNKRGIPTGYLACLEHRLLQTEAALFDVLSAVEGETDGENAGSDSSKLLSILSETSSTQSKTSRLEEWKRLPLQTRSQQRTWLHDKRLFVQRHDQVDNSSDPAVIPQRDRQWHNMDHIGTSSPGESIIGERGSQSVYDPDLSQEAASGGPPQFQSSSEQSTHQNFQASHGAFPSSPWPLQQVASRHDGLDTDLHAGTSHDLVTQGSLRPPEKPPYDVPDEGQQDELMESASGSRSIQWQKYF